MIGQNGPVTRAAQTVRDRLVEYVESSGFGAHGLHVRIGDEVAEHRWGPDVREDIHSAAKGVCVLAAAIAEAEGLISLDAPLSASLDGVAFGSGVADLSLRRLLNMSSGIDLPWSETLMTDWPDLAREFLGRDSRGQVFQYSNASTYTAMFVLGARVGDVLEYVTPRLFEPLGLAGVSWDRCPNGRVVAGEGISLRTEELARIGQLIRDGGVRAGQRLVPAPAIAAMHSNWVVSGTSPGYERYALSGWDGPGDAWRLHGAHGQMIIFAGDAVVTITAADHFGADAAAAEVVAACRDEPAMANL